MKQYNEQQGINSSLSKNGLSTDFISFWSNVYTMQNPITFSRNVNIIKIARMHACLRPNSGMSE